MQDSLCVSIRIRKCVIPCKSLVHIFRKSSSLFHTLENTCFNLTFVGDLRLGLVQCDAVAPSDSKPTVSAVAMLVVSWCLSVCVQAPLCCLPLIHFLDWLSTTCAEPRALEPVRMLPVCPAARFPLAPIRGSRSCPLRCLPNVGCSGPWASCSLGQNCTLYSCKSQS